MTTPDKHDDARQDDLLQVQHLVVTYKQRMSRVTAVADVSFAVTQGTTLALIGESGSGKSTIAKAICGLGPVSEGRILFKNEAISAAPDAAQAAGAAGIQIVFQDPRSSLDPRWPVWRSVIEPCAARYRKTGDKGRSQAIALLQRVGLSEDLADRKPGQLSGGQRQRVTIARAIAPSPRLIILDEAVSALDVSVRNEILALLESLKNDADLSYLLITHDMGAVVQIASEVAVMYLGKLVEFGSAADVVGKPMHPYTRALISAVPTFQGKGRKRGTQGVHISDSSNPPAGCRYHPRCLHARDICKTTDPDSRMISGRSVACHLAEMIVH